MSGGARSGLGEAPLAPIRTLAACCSRHVIGLDAEAGDRDLVVIGWPRGPGSPGTEQVCYVLDEDGGLVAVPWRELKPFRAICPGVRA